MVEEVPAARVSPHPSAAVRIARNGAISVDGSPEVLPRGTLALGRMTATVGALSRLLDT